MFVILEIILPNLVRPSVEVFLSIFGVTVKAVISSNLMVLDVIFASCRSFVLVGQKVTFAMSIMLCLTPHVSIKKLAMFRSSFLMMGWSGFRSGIS